MSETEKKASKATKRAVAAEPITTDLTDTLAQINQIVNEAAIEAAKVQLGVKAAGSRFRLKIRSVNNLVKQVIKRSIEIRDGK
jgi:hypothetical protein